MEHKKDSGHAIKLGRLRRTQEEEEEEEDHNERHEEERNSIQLHYK